MLKIFSRYEFWSFWLFYTPMVPVWLWYSFKSKSLVYFCNANPGIEWGGFTQYSKYKIINQLNQQLLPKTIFLPSGALPKSPPLDFPFVAKPDVGERGKQVELITNQTDWEHYTNNGTADVFVQEFMTEPLEFGVFYVRLPNDDKGKILSITGKEFLEFTGDGNSTLKEFIEQNPRAKKRETYLKSKFKQELNLVLQKGESMILEQIGNHNRGTKFMDCSHLITPELEHTIDHTSKQISSFFYGRYDVKTNSIADLKKGKFRVIEVNGSNSEATHIYDPKHQLLFAYKEVLRHLHWQYKIALQNKKNGHPWHSSIGLFKVLLNL